MTARTCGRGVRDEVDRVGRARVLGELGAFQVEHTGVGVHHDVFEYGAEVVRGLPDVGLGLLRQLDNLGVATPLEVEYAPVAPPMLVVTDEGALRVGGEGGLAGARETKEEGGVAFRADVRRAV